LNENITKRHCFAKTK